MLKRLLLNPDGQDGGAAQEPAVIAATPSVAEKLNATKAQPLQKPQTSRAATEAEKKVEFSVKGITDELGIEQLPPQGTSAKAAGVSSSQPPSASDGVDADEPPSAGAAGASDTSGAQRSESEHAAGQDDPAVIRVSKPAGSFDYTGYSAEEVTILKNMSVQSRDHVSKLMKDSKRLTQEVRQASFLQHPDAYTLDPDFKNMQTEKYFFDKEADYWKQQLSNIKAGESWRPVIKWNRDGTPVLGEERPPTSEHEEAVRLAMNECFQLSQNTSSRAQQYAQQHQQRYMGDLQAINQEQARRFEWVADPKKMDSKLDVPGVGQRTLSEIKNDFVSLFPSYQRNTAGVDVAANLFIALQVLSSRLREAEGQKQIAETKVDEVRRAEPTSTVRPSTNTKSVNGVKTFSLEGMPS